MSDLSAVVELGFRKVGYWQIDGQDIFFTLDSNRNKTNFLYAFTVGTGVKYIGKSTLSVHRRMMGYKNPEPTQKTNIRNNESILISLTKGFDVDIYALEEEEVFTYKGYKLNLAAGLEDILIFSFVPEWNVRK